MIDRVLAALEAKVLAAPPPGFSAEDVRHYLRTHRRALLAQAAAALTREPASQEDLLTYDAILIAFSGGKDSLACLLHLLSLGAPRARMELWHHEVDGREGGRFIDWPCTADYVRKVAAAFEIPVFFSWKVGGFEREMLRCDTPTAPTAFETPAGEVRYLGGQGEPGTREQYPQVSQDLTVRWCSSYLKIDVAAAALRNQARFDEARVLFVTGERAEESAGRARYARFEPHRTDLARPSSKRAGGGSRWVDHWRPVLPWSTEDVWAIIRRYGVNPHPAYRLGFGRVSCAGCIFGNAAQFRSFQQVLPQQFEKMATYEARFGKTVKRTSTLRVLAARGEPYPMAVGDIEAARSETFDEPVLLGERWVLPRGAFGDACGPT